MRLGLLALTPVALWAAASDGAALYKTRCAGCHDGKPQPRMPLRAELAARTPENIYKAMFEGAMVPQSADLSDEEGRAIARYVTAKEFGTIPAAEVTNRCGAPPPAFSLNAADWNGWGNDPSNARYQPRPGLSAAEVPRLKLKWAFGFNGDVVAFAQPTVAGGRVFVGSAGGTVYSLDAVTGCIYWTYAAGASVRNAVSIGRIAAGGYAAYFGDVRAFAHAVDAATGKPLWKVKIDDHPVARITGSPVFYSGRLYVPVSSIEEASAMMPTYECCKFRGSLVGLDGATGREIWKSYSVPDPPEPIRKASNGAQLYGPAGAAIWSSPTVDAKRKLIYAATGNSYTEVDINTSDAVLAFDMETGRLVWSSQVQPNDNFTMGCGRPGKPNCPENRGPDFDLGSSPVLRTLPDGRQIIVAAQKSAVVYGLDPDQRGKILWQTRVGQGGALGGVEWGHAADDRAVYAGVSDRFRAPGGLYALRFDTGEKLWSAMTQPKPDCPPRQITCVTAISAAISVMPGVVFAGSLDGHFRAFSARTGEVIWDFDAARPFDTVNGVKAKGGSFDAPGPTIANGMVFTTSGYGMWGGMAGNVLLAFSVDGK